MCSQVSELLDLGVSCPNLISNYNPACQELYAYYKLTGAEVTSGQTVLDSSGKSNEASNGESYQMDSRDCSR